MLNESVLFFAIICFLLSIKLVPDRLAEPPSFNGEFTFEPEPLVYPIRSGELLSEETPLSQFYFVSSFYWVDSLVWRVKGIN